MRECRGQQANRGWDGAVLRIKLRRAFREGCGGLCKRTNRHFLCEVLCPVPASRFLHVHLDMLPCSRTLSVSPVLCAREAGRGVLISSFSFSLSPFLYDRIFSHTLAPECTSARLLPGLSIVSRIRMRRLHERMSHKGMPGDRTV